jgi:cyanophycin synthetase
MFDRILIKEDSDRRGRGEGEVAALFESGIKEVNPKFPYEVILDEVDALNNALDSAAAGALIVIFPEKVERSIEIIESRQPPELRQSDYEPVSSSVSTEPESNNSAIASL